MIAIQTRVLLLDRVDRSKRDVGAVDLGKGNGAIQCNDRSGREFQKLVVKLQNLPPVRDGCRWRIAVNGVDGGLDLVRAWLIAAETVAHDALAFGDQRVIPHGAIL